MTGLSVIDDDATTVQARILRYMHRETRQKKREDNKDGREATSNHLLCEVMRKTQGHISESNSKPAPFARAGLLLKSMHAATAHDEDEGLKSYKCNACTRRTLLRCSAEAFVGDS